MSIAISYNLKKSFQVINILTWRLKTLPSILSYTYRQLFSQIFQASIINCKH